jgi:hypothetical protein
VRPPRFRIAWLMVAVAIAALDFGAMRAIIGSRGGRLGSETGILLLFGALPMANLLAAGILIAHRRPGSRPFLLGFEAFGAVALAQFIILANVGRRGELLMPYLEALIRFTQIIGQNRPFVVIPITCFGAVVILGWSQLAFALIGAFLSRKYKVTITRR